jgi:hypothetical protein
MLKLELMTELKMLMTPTTRVEVVQVLNGYWFLNCY